MNLTPRNTITTLALSLATQSLNAQVIETYLNELVEESTVLINAKGEHLNRSDDQVQKQIKEIANVSGAIFRALMIQLPDDIQGENKGDRISTESALQEAIANTFKELIPTPGDFTTYIGNTSLLEQEILRNITHHINLPDTSFAREISINLSVLNGTLDDPNMTDEDKTNAVSKFLHTAKQVDTTKENTEKAIQTVFQSDSGALGNYVTADTSLVEFLDSDFAEKHKEEINDFYSSLENIREIYPEILSGIDDQYLADRLIQNLKKIHTEGAQEKKYLHADIYEAYLETLMETVSTEYQEVLKIIDFAGGTKVLDIDGDGVLGEKNLQKPSVNTAFFVGPLVEMLKSAGLMDKTYEAATNVDDIAVDPNTLQSARQFLQMLMHYVKNGGTVEALRKNLTEVDKNIPYSAAKKLVISKFLSIDGVPKVSEGNPALVRHSVAAHAHANTELHRDRTPDKPEDENIFRKTVSVNTDNGEYSVNVVCEGSACDITSLGSSGWTNATTIANASVQGIDLSNPGTDVVSTFLGHELAQFPDGEMHDIAFVNTVVTQDKEKLSDALKAIISDDGGRRIIVVEKTEEGVKYWILDKDEKNNKDKVVLPAPGYSLSFTTEVPLENFKGWRQSLTPGLKGKKGEDTTPFLSYQVTKEIGENKYAGGRVSWDDALNLALFVAGKTEEGKSWGISLDKNLNASAQIELGEKVWGSVKAAFNAMLSVSKKGLLTPGFITDLNLYGEQSIEELTNAVADYIIKLSQDKKFIFSQIQKNVDFYDLTKAEQESILNAASLVAWSNVNNVPELKKSEFGILAGLTFIPGPNVIIPIAGPSVGTTDYNADFTAKPDITKKEKLEESKISLYRGDDTMLYREVIDVIQMNFPTLPKNATFSAEPLFSLPNKEIIVENKEGLLTLPEGYRFSNISFSVESLRENYIQPVIEIQKIPETHEILTKINEAMTPEDEKNLESWFTFTKEQILVLKQESVEMAERDNISEDEAMQKVLLDNVLTNASKSMKKAIMNLLEKDTVLLKDIHTALTRKNRIEMAVRNYDNNYSAEDRQKVFKKLTKEPNIAATKMALIDLFGLQKDAIETALLAEQTGRNYDVSQGKGLEKHIWVAPEDMIIATETSEGKTVLWITKKGEPFDLAGLARQIEGGYITVQVYCDNPGGAKPLISNIPITGEITGSQLEVSAGKNTFTGAFTVGIDTSVETKGKWIPVDDVQTEVRETIYTINGEEIEPVPIDVGTGNAELGFESLRLLNPDEAKYLGDSYITNGPIGQNADAMTQDCTERNGGYCPTYAGHDEDTGTADGPFNIPTGADSADPNIPRQNALQEVITDVTENGGVDLGEPISNGVDFVTNEDIATAADKIRTQVSDEANVVVSDIGKKAQTVAENGNNPHTIIRNGLEGEGLEYNVTSTATSSHSVQKGNN